MQFRTSHGPIAAGDSRFRPALRPRLDAGIELRPTRRPWSDARIQRRPTIRPRSSVRTERRTTLRPEPAPGSNLIRPSGRGRAPVPNLVRPCARGRTPVSHVARPVARGRTLVSAFVRPSDRGLPFVPNVVRLSTRSRAPVSNLIRPSDRSLSSVSNVDQPRGRSLSSVEKVDQPRHRFTLALGRFTRAGLRRQPALVACRPAVPRAEVVSAQSEHRTTMRRCDSQSHFSSHCASQSHFSGRRLRVPRLAVRVSVPAFDGFARAAARVTATTHHLGLRKHEVSTLGPPLALRIPRMRSGRGESGTNEPIMCGCRRPLAPGTGGGPRRGETPCKPGTRARRPPSTSRTSPT